MIYADISTITFSSSPSRSSAGERTDTGNRVPALIKNVLFTVYLGIISTFHTPIIMLVSWSGIHNHVTVFVMFLEACINTYTLILKLNELGSVLVTWLLPKNPTKSTFA